MIEGAPSLTAQRVAAARASLERMPVPFGDAQADDALCRDVAGAALGDTAPDRVALVRYLQGRTRAFDKVVVHALEREVTQIVIAGAGYDGRALRYVKPGVRWWEVDHPDTQADKRARLACLGIAAEHIRFVAHDLESPGLAAALRAAGFEPDGLSFVMCEGVTAYLTTPAIAALFDDLRALAGPGTRFALSGPAPNDTPERDQRGARLQESVSAAGEPFRNRLTADEFAGLLAAHRWQTVELSENAQRIGFMVAMPVWKAAGAGQPKSVGRLAAYMERMLYRTGGEGIGEHVEAQYGVRIKRAQELDLGVYRLDRDGGTPWIARVFPAARSIDSARGDAALLDALGKSGFAAERCAAPEPVSVYADQPVLVTDFAPGKPPAKQSPREDYAALGTMLAELHSLELASPVGRRPGGAWHHLIFDATPQEEMAELATLFRATRHRVKADEVALYDELAGEIGQLDGCQDLPHALVHADFVPRNVLQAEDGRVTVIDWSGAGWGPRIVSLGCLLWAASMTAPPCAAAALKAYRAKIELTAEELHRLGAAMRLRPLVLACWSFAAGRQRLAAAVESWHASATAAAAALAKCGLSNQAHSPRGGR